MPVTVTDIFHCVFHCYQPTSCQSLSLTYSTGCFTAISLRHANRCDWHISLCMSLLSSCIMPTAVTDLFCCLCVTPFTIHHFLCVCHCYQPASCQPLSLIYFTACHFYQTASCQPLSLIYFTVCFTVISLHHANRCHWSIPSFSLRVSLPSAYIVFTACVIAISLHHASHCNWSIPLRMSLLSACIIFTACVTAFSLRHANRCHWHFTACVTAISLHHANRCHWSISLSHCFQPTSFSPRVSLLLAYIMPTSVTDLFYCATAFGLHHFHCVCHCFHPTSFSLLSSDIIFTACVTAISLHHANRCHWSIPLRVSLLSAYIIFTTCFTAFSLHHFHRVCHYFQPTSCQPLSLSYFTVTAFSLHHFHCVCHCFQPTSFSPRVSLLSAYIMPTAVTELFHCVTAFSLHHFHCVCHCFQPTSFSPRVSLLSAYIMPTAVTDLFHCVCHCFQPTSYQPLSLSYFTVSLLSAYIMPEKIEEEARHSEEQDMHRLCQQRDSSKYTLAKKRQLRFLLGRSSGSESDESFRGQGVVLPGDGAGVCPRGAEQAKADSGIFVATDSEKSSSSRGGRHHSLSNSNRTGSCSDFSEASDALLRGEAEDEGPQSWPHIGDVVVT